MKFPSYNIPAGSSFLDIVRLADRVQRTATSHLLDEKDLRNCFAWATDTYTNTAEAAAVEVFTGFTFKGFTFASACTYLYIRGAHGAVVQGCVKRMTAPERKFGRGSRYVITLHRATDKATVPPGFRMADFEQDHLGAQLVLESLPERAA